MRLFTVIDGNPYTYKESRMPKRFPHVITPVPISRYGYETIVLCKKEMVSFDEVLDIFCDFGSKKNVFGAMSLIYWQYYGELNAFLQSVAADEARKQTYKRAIKRFYKQYLSMWIWFVRYSDDTLFLQNEVFRDMERTIKAAYGWEYIYQREIPQTKIKAYVLTTHLKYAYNQKQKILTEAVTRDGITPRTCPSWDISTKPLHTSGAVCYFDGEVYHIFEYDTRDYTHQRVGDVEETLFYLLHYYAQEAAIRYAEKQAADKTMWDRQLANDKFAEYMALLGEPYARLAAKKINNA